MGRSNCDADARGNVGDRGKRLLAGRSPVASRSGSLGLVAALIAFVLAGACLAAVANIHTAAPTQFARAHTRQAEALRRPLRASHSEPMHVGDGVRYPWNTTLILKCSETLYNRIQYMFNPLPDVVHCTLDKRQAECPIDLDPSPAGFARRAADGIFTLIIYEKGVQRTGCDGDEFYAAAQRMRAAAPIIPFNAPTGGWTHGIYFGSRAVQRSLGTNVSRPLLCSLLGEPFWEFAYKGELDEYDLVLKTSRLVGEFESAVVMAYHQGIASFWAAASAAEAEAHSMPWAPTVFTRAAYIAAGAAMPSAVFPAFKRLVTGQSLRALIPRARASVDAATGDDLHFCAIITKSLYMTGFYYVDALARQAMAVLLAEKKGLSAPCANFGLAGEASCPVGKNISGWTDGRSYVQSASCMNKARFIITMENTQAEGYTSEKLLIGALSTAVPIYFGNPRILDETAQDSVSGARRFVFCDVNMSEIRNLVFPRETDAGKRYRDVRTMLQHEDGTAASDAELVRWASETFREALTPCIDEVLAIDANETLYQEMVRQPLLRKQDFSLRGVASGIALLADVLRGEYSL